MANNNNSSNDIPSFGSSASYREPYSHNTAYLMARLSRLSYLRFNPLIPDETKRESFIQVIRQLMGNVRVETVKQLIKILDYDHNKELAKLKKELDDIGMKLVDEPFDVEGTQAFLAHNGKFLVLAFRGTEANSTKDIKADATAKLTRYKTGGRVHKGFMDAFEHVEFEIQDKLQQYAKYQKYPLYITGHSLGGALATIASRRLQHQGGIAAVYTFGSPRVGDEDWVSDMEVPLYRLVNAADCVTMLPPNGDVITVLNWLMQFVPWLGPSISKALMDNFDGYIHCGNMRYLTNCQKGNYDSVKLLYTVSLFFRIKAFLFRQLPWRKFLSDHSISVYEKKLKIIAQRRASQAEVPAGESTVT